MFYRYEIKRDNNKEILYLYFDMNYEMANELGEDIDYDKEKIEKEVLDYINDKNIDFKGDKVFLVSKGLVVKTLELKNKDIKIEVLDDKSDYANIKYKVKLRGNNKEDLYLKEFLIGVMFTNAIHDLPLEVMKALCVLYRTYTYSKMNKDGFLEVSDQFMKYKTNNYYKLLLIEDYDIIYNRIKAAVNDTDCIFMAYDNNYILPFIHHTNNGYTDEDKDIPYLERRYSLWDLLSEKYLNIKEFEYNELERVLKVSKKDLQNIKILELSKGNRIKRIKVGKKTYTGEEFRKRLDLDSCDITILVNDNNIKLITRGYGHGLGLSIKGATELAESGCNYLQILNYYFPRCQIKKYV